MIDGPHKSLPLKKHWKDFDLRADTKAYSLEERRQSLYVAVRKEFPESILTPVRNVLCKTKQGSLCIGDTVEQIEAMREYLRGSAAGNLLIDCVIHELSKEQKGEKALQNALKTASEEVAHAHSRSIKEHHCQEEEDIKTLESLCKRIDETVQEADFDFIASELIQEHESENTLRKLSKRTGVDEGPELD